jgi:histidinol-phosphate/aromatic aminotransferase/cobyric acid decarboxylase-like protein
MSFSANWMYFFAVLGGLLAAFRIWQNLQKLRRQKNDSWDARLIDQLRKRGSDPFKPHDVDFFLAFPTQQAAEDLATQLRTEGFDAKVVDEPASGDLRWSLHAHKSMQLTVPDMQELSRRLSEAATLKQGRYDGWSAKEVPKPESIADRMR